MVNNPFERFGVVLRQTLGKPPTLKDRCGAKRDSIDPRDKLKTPTTGELYPRGGLATVPAGRVFDQGYVGSCAGCAAANAIYCLTRKIGQTYAFASSPLYIYYKARELNGETSIDCGSELRNVMKTLQVGVPALHLYPSMTTWKVRPPESVVENAAFKVKGYERIPVDGVKTIKDMVAVLGVEKLPIIIGANVYDAAMLRAGKTGSLGLSKGNGAGVGGHAMLVTGYFNYSADNPMQTEFMVLNSWGSAWGLDGYCNMTAEYLVQEVFDMWTFSREYF
jgi:hypothetical protein